MIRQTMRLLALAAAGLVLAGGAWGQVLRQGSNPAFMVAAEYFGASAGREIQSSKFPPPGVTESDPADLPVRPYVSLTVGGATTSDTPTITAGNTADITFTLGGATFSETVAPANLDRRNGGCDSATKANLPVSVQIGGAKGDSSVTFRVTSPDDAGLANGNVICFWVPNVQATLVTVSAPGVMPAVMGVTVTASIAQGVANNNPFPTLINGNNVDTTGMPTADNSSGAPGPITDRIVFTAAPALATSLGAGGTGLVSLADRTKIASGGTADPSAADPSMAAMGVSVGSLSIAASPAAGMIWKLDGSGAVATASTETSGLDTLDASLGGQVMISVGGPFQDGDKVVFGTGTSARQVEPDEDGMASTAVELKPVTDMGIVYVPGGAGVLKPSTFAAAAMYSFNSLDNNNSLPIMTSTGRIDYAGINVEAYAYGVVRGGGIDTSYGRATCEAASGMCQLFADCTDQDGMNYFGGPVPIPAGATAVIDSDALAGALGGGWEKGRGRCDIYSTAPLAFQHMIRSHGLLINNSVVVGRHLDEDTSTAEAIKEVVDDICASVGNADADGAVGGEADYACMPVDTMPSL